MGDLSSPHRTFGEGLRFVGREAEVGLIQEALGALERGTGGLLQVVGEPGIGKTRLLAVARDLATGRGIRVASGRTAGFEGRMPFQVLVEALHGFFEGERPEEAVPGVAAEVLAGTVPELLAPNPEAAQAAAHSQAAADDVDRFRLFQALRQTLLTLAARPLVMLLDDVHWADQASIDFLEFVSRRPIPAPLLLVIAHRGRQTPARLRYALAHTADHGAAARIDLGPLTPDEAAELIGARAGSPRAEELYAMSEGNPLYLLELDRTDIRSPRSAPDPRAGSGGHSRLESLVLGELMELSPGERTVAWTAAVLGGSISASILAEVITDGADDGAGGSPASGDVEARLAALIDRDLIRPVAGGPAFAFRHPLVCRAVYDSVPPARRITVHRRVLALLVRDGASAVELGRHIEQCVDTYSPEDFAILVRAGQDAMGTAPLTAAHWFRAALRLLPQTPDFTAARRQTESRLARALGLGGRFEASRELLHGILHADQTGEIVDRGAAVVLLAHVEQRLGRYPEALALLRAEVARLVPAPSAERVRLCLELGLTALLANDYPSARADISWARDAARESGDVLGEATALAFGTFGEICVGRVADARAAADQAGALVDALPDSALAGERETLCMLGWAEFLLERFADAERHLARARAVIRRAGYRHGLPHVLVGQALVDLFVGHLSGALEHAEEAEEAAHLVGSDHLLGIALAVKAPVLVNRSRPGEDGAALKATRRATELFRGSAADSWWARSALMLQGYTEFSALSADGARTCVEHAIRAGGPDLRLLGAPLIPQYCEVLVGALVRLGDLPRATAFAALASESADRLDLPGQSAHAARARGLLAALRGEHETAVAEFAAAEAGFAAAGKALEQARTPVFGWRSLVRTGRREEAVAALRRASESAVAHGWKAVAAEVEQASARLSDTDPRHPPHRADPLEPARPADGLAILTGREREVADLVGAGRSNRQIATRLRLSERTVETHLANVYRKLGVASRVTLAGLLTGEPRSPSIG